MDMKLRMMRWDASPVMEPVAVGCLVSFNLRHPRLGDPARVDPTPACVPAASAPRSALFLHDFSSVSNGLPLCIPGDTQQREGFAG